MTLSYGKDNTYRHLHDEVMANLNKLGTKAYSTTQDGTIIVKTNGSTYSIDAKVFTAPITPPVIVEPTEPEGDVNSGTYVIPGAPTSFKNCDEMREYYPNGVSSSHPAYAPARDGDKDGWACEK